MGKVQHRTAEAEQREAQERRREDQLRHNIAMLGL